MRFNILLAAVTLPLITAMLNIISSSYNAATGVLTIDEFAYTDAPASYNVVLIGGGNKTIIASGLTPANGTTTFQVPPGTPTGTYHIALVGAGYNSSTTYVSGKPFSVTPFNSTASITASTLIPTSTLSLLTTSTVFSSGSLTTTIAATMSVPINETLSVVPTTSGSSVGAATATITGSSSKSGAMNMKVPVTAMGVVLGGVVFAAAIVL